MPEEVKNETTNAVLKESIDGFKELTDERLLNLKQGITDIKLLMQGFATKIEVEEVKKDIFNSIKRIEDWQTNHGKEDETNFGKIISQNTGVGKQVDSLKIRMAYGMGALAAITSAAPYIIKYLFKV